MTDDDGIPFGELPVLMQAAGIALTRDNRLDPSDQNTAHPLAHAEGGAAVLAFSLMVDSVERFDTLLMEIRHLQMNLIYFMSAPVVTCRAARAIARLAICMTSLRCAITGGWSSRRSCAPCAADG